MTGAKAIKSNPIPAGGPTHKVEKNYTTEVLQQEWKSWVINQSSQPAGLAMGGGDPKKLYLEGKPSVI